MIDNNQTLVTSVSTVSMHRRYTDISDLLNSSQYHCKDVPSLLPLLFDRVFEGRATTSPSHLLTLPSELIATILQHLSSASLASLALVNSECLQLARPYQFVTVKLDGSHFSIQIIQSLQAEASGRSPNSFRLWAPVYAVSSSRHVQRI